MLYEKYEQKLKKRVKTRNFFYSTRFIWFTLIAASIITTGTLLGTKGVITSFTINGKEAADKVSYSYGDKIDIAGESFLGGNTKTEWRKSDSNTWSSNTPTEPGEYEVRVSGTNLFGGEYSSKSTMVTINPRDIDIEVDDISTYGTKPGVTISGLAYRDSLSDYEIVYDDISKVNPKVKVSNIKILNENKEDVTSCYNWSFPEYIDHVMKSVKLSISTESSSKIYDGKVLTNKKFSYSGLIDGDSIDEDAIYNSMISSALDYTGLSVKNEFDLSKVKVTNSNGEDVTAHYAISPNYGTLRIEKRDITLTSQNVRKVYDGTPIDNYEKTNQFLAENSGIEVGGDGLAILGGDYLKVDFKNTNFYHAGETKNDFEYAIMREIDGEAIDVSSCYNITKVVGKLKIVKRTIEYTSKEEDFTFDGQSHTGSSVSLTGGLLAEGDNAQITMLNTVSKANESKDNAFSVKIFNDEENRTSDYEITKKVGKISISQRPLTVEFIDQAKIYDGEPLRLDDSEDKYILKGISGDSPLANGHKLKITGSSITNVGSIEDTPKVTILDSVNNDVTSSYNLTVLPATLTINKRDISLIIDDVSGVYRGETGYQYSSYRPSGLIYGDNLNFSSEKVVHQTNGSGVVASFDYTITDFRGNDVTDNYQKLCEANHNVTYGTIQVDKKPITITPTFNSLTKYYDGKAIELTGISVDPYLALGDGIIAECTNLPIEPTDGPIAKTIDVDTFKIVNSKGIDVTDDYEVTFKSVELSINKRNLNLSFTKAEQDINDYYTFEYTSSGALNNHRIDDEILKYEVDEDAKTVTFNTSTVAIRDINSGKDVTHCYDIYAESSKIAKASTDLYFEQSANKLTTEYDGSDEGWSWLSSTSASSSSSLAVTLSKGTLKTGHVVRVEPTTPYPEPFFTSASKTVSYQIKVYDEANNDVSSTYIIHYPNEKTSNQVTLNLTKAELTIQGESYNGEYDGKEQPNFHYDLGEGYSITSGSLKNGDTIKATGGESYLSGTYDCAPNIQILHNGTIDVTSLYNIKVLKGRINIKKRSLNINFGNNEKVYDGIEYLAEDLKILAEAKGLNLADNDQLSIKIRNGNHILNPNTYDLKNIVDVSVWCGGQDRSAHYNIQISGSIKITKRPISVAISDVIHTYNGFIYNIPSSGYSITSGDLIGNDSIHLTYSPLQSKDIAGNKIYEDFIGATIVDEYGNDVSACYSVSFTKKGSYQILKKSITLEIEDRTQEWTGEHPYLPAPTIYNPEVVCSDDSISVSTFNIPDLRPNNTYQWNEWLNINITNKDYINVTDLYDITVLGGTITFDRAVVTFKVKDQVSVIGKTTQPTEATVEVSGLVSGDSLIVEYNLRYEDYFKIGKFKPKYSVRIIDASGNDVTNKYDIIDETKSYTLTLNFPNLYYQVLPGTHIYNGSSVDIVQREHPRLTYMGELNEFEFNNLCNFYNIIFEFYTDNTYKIQVLDINAGNKDIFVEKGLEPYFHLDIIGGINLTKRTTKISILNESTQITSLDSFKSPYDLDSVSFSNFPLALGNSVKSITYLYDGQETVDLYKYFNSSIIGIQSAVINVTIQDIVIVDKDGYDVTFTYYDILNLYSATGQLMIVYNNY